MFVFVGTLPAGSIFIPDREMVVLLSRFLRPFRTAVFPAVRAAVFMAVLCLVVYMHSRFTILAAAQAAPYPLSMFITLTPGAQLTSMLARAALPCPAMP